MVRHLEHVGPQRPPRALGRGHERALGGRLDVAGEQDRPLAVDDAQHERAVVAGEGGVAGPDDLDPRAADLEHVARARLGHRDSRLGERRAKRRVAAV